jgi:hypothetical protein
MVLTTPAAVLCRKRPQTFDGNLTSAPRHWWFVGGLRYDEPDRQEAISALIDLVTDGRLDWAVFPMEGLRL